MNLRNMQSARRDRRSPYFAILPIYSLLLIIALACSLPGLSRKPSASPTPTLAASQVSALAPTVAPTPTPQPFPPQLVESDPPVGSEIPLQGSIKLYFNQPIDRASVEASLADIPGNFEWIDDTTLIFTPDGPLPPDTRVELSLDTTVESENGLPLDQPVNLVYHSAGYLRLAQRLPEPGSSAVDPTSGIVAAFNRPVVPLGADPASLPTAFSLEPAAEGRGEWLNTSTYIFYPKPALRGGVEYTVRLNAELIGTDGSPFEEVESWSFSTDLPRLVMMEPPSGSGDIRLDTDLVLTFNQAMDAQSVAANFALLGPNGNSIQGDSSWNEEFTVLTFNPTGLLKRDRVYTVMLSEDAQALGGTPLDAGLQTSLRTIPDLEVITSDPVEAGIKNVYAGVFLTLSAPIQQEDILQFVTLTPQVRNLEAYFNDFERTLGFFGDFAPDTDYTLIISPNLPDEWSGRLGQEFILNFRTAPLDPAFFISVGSEVLFLTPEDLSLTAQVTNLSQLTYSIGSLPLEDFVAMLAEGGYEIRQAYQPDDERSFRETIDVPANQSTAVEFPLTPDGSTLEPGLYFLRFNFTDEEINAGPYLLVVGETHLVFKLSTVDALAWAVDLKGGSPVEDAPLSILSDTGEVLASGRTDQDGVFRAPVSIPSDGVYRTYLAMLGQPGDEFFSMALSNWSQGVEGYAFAIPVDYGPPQLQAYLYTDRPIYRPGQTVFFRAVVRQAYNGRYTLPDQPGLTLTLWDNFGNQLKAFDLPLSAFGTAHGSYALPEDLAPGVYNLSSEEVIGSAIYFQVAVYRKPEIDLQVSFNSEQAQAGDSLAATVNARYFFDAPAGDVPVHWALFKQPSDFYLPGYQVGKQDERWMYAFPVYDFPIFGEQISEGDGRTDPSGVLELEFATESTDSRYRYILEVTAQDESGLPVSSRTRIEVNPAEFYIGLRPDAWIGQVGRELGFEVLVVDWRGDPAGQRALRAEFQQVVYEQVESENAFAFPTFTPSYTIVGSADFTTGADGVARLAFTPPEAGTYQLDVRGLDLGEESARTQALLWVGGAGQAVWPNLPNQRLRLTADKDSYQPGETAQVFIPNPFGDGALALVTVERGTLLRHQVLNIDGAGADLSLPLGDEDAPNVYVSVTLLKGRDGGDPDFRQGYIDLPVAPVEQTLSVALTSDALKTGPGEQVTFLLRVSDASGNPVEGEFSLAVVDKAVLALADPNSQDILPAFYGEQPLGVQTGMGLAAYTQRQTVIPGGMGGGGGDGSEAPTVVRESFPDTAYWNAGVVTDANGEAQVTVALPDSLTTWQVDLRGLTADTRVGQARDEVIATKDLLVRPVTPRFLVLGDHALLAAVVQNNTLGDLQAEVSLQATGFALDDASPATQQVNIPAGGRTRLEWSGTTQDVDSVDLIFTARSGELQDAARPTQGMLPVLRYTAPQTFGSSGLLDSGGDLLELVSLPRSFDPNAGGLDLELAPSLGAAMVSSLEALEHFPYECNEQTVSRFLPNLETYRVLQEFGLEEVDLQARLDRTLEEGLELLFSRQNEDGGWGWWRQEESDAYTTAYVLLGLARAREAGVSVKEEAFQNAIAYLRSNLPSLEGLQESWQFDRLVFEFFVLSQAGVGDLDGTAALYEARDRLSPWAQALLALTLESLSPGDERAQTLFSNLESTALRSASGAHWENPEAGWHNMSSALHSTAVVLYALAQYDPAAPLVADAMRYLMSNRGASGAWASTYETAWALMALAEVMKGTGELGGDFDFAATLNSAPLVSGQASGETNLNPVKASSPIADLHPDDPNGLLIQRTAGPGRLYYSVQLRVNRPVEEVAPLDRGFNLARAYYPSDETCQESDCPAIHSAKVGDLVTVRLTLAVPQTAYHLLLEDYIPAGAEVLDTSLKTSKLGVEPAYDPQEPFAEGWGWWYFNDPQIYDDHIAWSAVSLPSGTYELVYTLVILQPGEYRLLPARAWQFYFPEVQGNSAGEIFEIRK